MLQVRKSHSRGISAIFFQCCFMIETQVFMAGSDFSGFFSRNHFLEGGFTFSLFSWGGGCFLLGGFVNYFIILLFVYYLFGGFDRGRPWASGRFYSENQNDSSSNAHRGFGTQLCYGAPGDLQVEK